MLLYYWIFLFRRILVVILCQIKDIILELCWVINVCDVLASVQKFKVLLLQSLIVPFLEPGGKVHLDIRGATLGSTKGMIGSIWRAVDHFVVVELLAW